MSTKAKIVLADRKGGFFAKEAPKSSEEPHHYLREGGEMCTRGRGNSGREKQSISRRGQERGHHFQRPLFLISSKKKEKKNSSRLRKKGLAQRDSSGKGGADLDGEKAGLENKGGHFIWKMREKPH